ncbi:ECF RNA polymerase sigma factor SigW [Pseudobythopirellula maris]|uniref:ECF RNA polymerase sigma factor SigW n=1 Tax=Pseudobythopirellula maris TaxID=2527991 RepID=A0A5C5ZNX9_9BACT|nr:sigma-70 family RNA polymerase sigma factor [Pseudobythopirellula maris]TWT88888.1 ECF RNA polymerase sigma factor SigW [Pseudobythopirellula maris]
MATAFETETTFQLDDRLADPLTEMTTEELVLEAQLGDRAAFGELVTRFEGMVQSVAMRRLGDHAEAQELSQEVLIKAMERLHQLKEPAAFGGWLRQITVRMAINRQVRRRRHVSAEPQTLEAVCVEPSTPIDLALTVERAEQVRDGMGRLGEMDRSTLEAFYMRGESLLEMSDAFSAPVGTIKRRLHVARKRLAVELAEAFAAADESPELLSA